MGKREHISAERILRVFRRDKFTCQYCGAKGVDLEIDHVIPIALGGDNRELNLITSCKKCNRKKGARLIKPGADKLGKGYVFYYEHNNQKVEVPANREFIDLFLKAIKEVQTNAQTLQSA